MCVLFSFNHLKCGEELSNSWSEFSVPWVYVWIFLFKIIGLELYLKFWNLKFAKELFGVF